MSAPERTLPSITSRPRLEPDGEAALSGNFEIGRAILVAVGVAADHDRLGPARDETRHVLADDWLAKDDPAQDVADGAVRASPHFLEMEFFDPRLVRGDGRALDADADRLDRLGASIVTWSLVASVLDRQVSSEIDVQIGMNAFMSQISCR